jgi:probable HAF family extracellular repeat protein
MTRQTLSAVLTAAFLMLQAVASAQAQYVLIDLGQVDGIGSFAVGINDSGQAGGWIITQSHDTRAVRSVNGQPFAYVPPLQSLSITTEGINLDGDLTGNVVVSPFPTFAYHAFRYSDQGGLVDLGTLGGQSSTGIGINSFGQVAGWSYTSSGVPRAFRSTPGQPLQELPIFGGTTSQSFAGWINDSGQVSGYAENSSGIFHAFRFTDGQPLLDLGALGGSFGSMANQINASGQVVGQASTASSGGHAFRYTDGIGMQDLDTLQTNDSVGQGINDAGDVVGYFIQSGLARAFRYTDQNGMVDLNSFIDVNSGWTLNAAYGINGHGQIVGVGTFNGQLNPRAFLLTPIPPDVTPPVISAVQANPAVLWPANHKMVPVHLTVDVIDNIDPAPTCRITAIVSNEPSSGTTDFEIIGDLDAALRAESVGPAGRTYSITVACTDASSNTASTIVQVRAPHDQSDK